MKYADLRKINVNEHVEKKNGLSYLSWAWAVDELLQRDESSTWEYAEPKQYGDTLMVFCTVHAFGKSRTAQLPVMDHRNKAIPNPDAYQVNTAMQRCLAKAISLHGIGLYIYAREDLPDDPEELERQAKLVKLMLAITHGNVVSKQYDAWEQVKALCKDHEEAANHWGMIDSATRRQIKQHGEDLKAGQQEEKPLAELLLGEAE